MSETSSILNVIQLLKFKVNPVFFVPLIVNRNGFSASKMGIAIIFCPLITVICVKVYFFTGYKSNKNEFHVHLYGFMTTVALFVASYLGYAVNSMCIAKILNRILSHSKFIIDPVFCRRVTRVLIAQLIIVHIFPFFLTVWCCFSEHLKAYNQTWEYLLDVWFDYLLRIHLTATTVLFSDAILLCYRIIAKVNNELVKVDRIEWCNLIEVDFISQGKVRPTNRVVSSNSELASVMSLYDSVCQCCADLNSSFGCSVSCSYICNMIQTFLVFFFLTKYGLNELWFFIFGASYNFLQNWFLLYTCETFTKEMQKSGIIVNKLILETKNQRQKELLQQFSIFLLHRNVKFTACGLFTFNYKLIYSVIATMITYLTLVHQLEAESKAITLSK